MAYVFPAKDPSEILDYAFNWRDLIGAASIISSTFTVTSGITVEDTLIDGHYTKAWISGGLAGTSYSITNKIILSSGLTYERTATLPIKER